MTTSDLQHVYHVMRHYDLKVYEVYCVIDKGKKAVWRIYTNDGIKYLKKVSNSERTLKYTVSAVKHLIKNGVCLPWINSTKSGSDYICIDGTCFILLDSVEGRTPNYFLRRDLEKIVEGLAIFHKASKGFHPLAETKAKKRLGLWVEDLHQQVDFMQEFYSYENSLRNSNPTGEIVLREFPAIYERAQKSLEGLKGQEYNDWTEIAKKEGCLCHQDFASGNLLINSEGELFVLDTDSIMVDIPARDLRKLLNKIMKKNGKWDWELTRRIFILYQSVNPLSYGQWQVVKYSIMYPYLFLGCMSKYYYQKDQDWSSEKYLMKLAEMSQVERSIEPILNGFDSLIPY